MSDNSSQRIATEMLTRFPIAGPDLGDGDVEPNYQVGASNIKISLNKTAAPAEMGRLDYDVHVETHSNTSGFEGGVYFRLLDDRGNVVYAIIGDHHGVNGKLIPGAPSKYLMLETKPIPLHVLTAVHSLEPNRARMEGAAWEKLKETLESLKKGADAVRDNLKAIGADIIEISQIIKKS